MVAIKISKGERFQGGREQEAHRDCEQEGTAVQPAGKTKPLSYTTHPYTITHKSQGVSAMSMTDRECHLHNGMPLSIKKN